MQPTWRSPKPQFPAFSFSPNGNNDWKEELGNMHVLVPGFYNRFFGCVAGLEEASEIIYKKCTEGSSPRFSKGGGLEWMAARPE